MGHRRFSFRSVPLEDAIRNMAVIEALFRSAESGKREKP